MRKTIAAFAILCASLLSSCGLLGSQSDGTPVDWPQGVIECVTTEAVIGIIDLVTDVLFTRGDGAEISDKGKDELEDLAREHGPSTVACAVNEVIKSATRPGAAHNVDRMRAGLRGVDFLEDVGTAVRDAEPAAP
jgi:hypothetical protein